MSEPAEPPTSRCPACGQHVIGAAAFCPHCGMRLAAAVAPLPVLSGTRKGPTIGKILLAILVAIFAVPVGAFGACAAIMTVSAGTSWLPDGVSVTLALVAGVVVFGLCIAGMIRLLR